MRIVDRTNNVILLEHDDGRFEVLTIKELPQKESFNTCLDEVLPIFKRLGLIFPDENE